MAHQSRSAVGFCYHHRGYEELYEYILVPRVCFLHVVYRVGGLGLAWVLSYLPRVDGRQEGRSQHTSPLSLLINLISMSP